MRTKIIYGILILCVSAVDRVVAICAQNRSLKDDLSKCLDTVQIKESTNVPEKK